MHTFPRPSERHLHVERTAVDATCPECGSTDISEYPVFSEGGWWNVRKCQQCLCSLQRQPGPRFGSYEPLGPSIVARQR
jgi:vanillate/4-hydroxybenzoate decarboxylase subunit D